jgi:hypothetical protein
VRLVMFKCAAPSALIESTTLIPTLRSGLFTAGPSDLKMKTGIKGTLPVFLLRAAALQVSTKSGSGPYFHSDSLILTPDSCLLNSGS